MTKLPKNFFSKVWTIDVYGKISECEVYMEDAMRRGEYRYPVKKEDTHITDEEKEKKLMETLGPIVYKDLKMYGLI